MLAPEPGITVEGVVTDVIDGDTVEVETRVRHRIRLEDCWCNEVRLGRNTDQQQKADGLRAKFFLQDKLAECGNQVVLHIPGNGGNLSKLTTLSRIVGRVWRVIGGKVEAPDVSRIMVETGHATKTKPSKD